MSSYFGWNALVLLRPTRAGCMQQVVFGDLNGRIGTTLLAARLSSGIYTVSDTLRGKQISLFTMMIAYFCCVQFADYL
jgi:hypothetical protein